MLQPEAIAFGDDSLIHFNRRLTIKSPLAAKANIYGRL